MTAAGVRAAVAEYDRLGRDTFLRSTGFGRARAYYLEHEGRLYDSKAIVGYAHGISAGILLTLGVPTPTAMALMGWSSAAMAKRYQHLVDSIRHDVARQVGGLLWASDGTPPGGGNGGAATALDPARSKAE